MYLVLLETIIKHSPPFLCDIILYYCIKGKILQFLGILKPGQAMLALHCFAPVIYYIWAYGGKGRHNLPERKQTCKVKLRTFFPSFLVGSLLDRPVPIGHTFCP